MGPSAPSKLTYLMGFHYVSAVAALEYVMFYEKLNPERVPEDDMNQFSEINIKHTGANKRRNRGNRMRKAASRILTACEWAEVLDGLNES